MARGCVAATLLNFRLEAGSHWRYHLLSGSQRGLYPLLCAGVKTEVSAPRGS